jgi:hypothetical protein
MAYLGAEYDGKNYVLREDVEGEKWDLLCASNPKEYDSKNRLILDKMSNNTKSNDSVGFLFTPIEADFTLQNRLITVGTKGPLIAKAIEDLDANVPFVGSGTTIIDTFDGDGGGAANQTIYSTNVPIASVTEVAKSGTPLTLVTTTPIADQYRIVDLENGEIELGLSETGTDNYTLTYEIDEGKIKAYAEEVTETVTVTTNVGTLSGTADLILEVDATGGSGGLKTIQYSGTPAAGACTVDLSAGTITFAAADAITSADIYYKNGDRPLGKTLQKKEAGNPIEVDFYGGFTE